MYKSLTMYKSLATFITIYKSLAKFINGCTKVKSHEWRCDVKLVRHVEGRKEEKDEEI